MHLLESYALLSGCKIDHPFINIKKINLPNNPFILLHSFNAKGSDRQYKYWNEVVQLLLNNTQFNFEIFQIGGLEDTTVQNTNDRYLGTIDYHELAYLIQNCELLLCFDSFPMHLASIFDKKIVAVFGRYIQNTRPYFGSQNNQIIITPSFDQYKPSFTYVDKFDLINQNSPVKICEATIQLLNKHKL